MKLKMKDALPTEYSRVLTINGIALDDIAIVADLAEIPVHAISKYLGLKKNRDDVGGTSLVLKDEKGNFIIAGIVKYHAPEEEDQAGNWSYEFTFNEEDVKETHQYLVTDTSFIEVVVKVMEDHSLAVSATEYILAIVLSFFIALKNVLEQNVTPTEEFEIESDTYFVATSAIEGDEKVYSLVPSGEMKRLIKDDSTLEG